MCRKLDAAIEKLIGEYDVYWKNGEPFIDYQYEVEPDYDWDDADYGAVPYYSTDGRAMILLDEKMHKRGYELAVIGSRDGKYCAYVTMLEGATDGKFTITSSESLSRALEAYRALAGKEWA